MGFIKNIALISAGLSLVVMSCSQSSESQYVSVHGCIIAETDDTFTLVQNGPTGNDTIVLPNNPELKARQNIFIQDSVIVRYIACGNDIVVDDIILISHHQLLSNVDELFVGSWNETDSEIKITFNSDQTTDTAGQRWQVRGKKFFLQTDDTALVYDIVRVDANTMTLCHADHTLNMHRSN